jgi:hypothetical protein
LNIDSFHGQRESCHREYNFWGKSDPKNPSQKVNASLKRFVDFTQGGKIQVYLPIKAFLNC